MLKAVVIEAPDRASVADVPAPEPGPNDVLIASRMAGVCRTDLEILAGLLPADRVSYPVIPGHEWSGTVVEVGAEVDAIAPGMRVVAEGTIPCRTCSQCAAGDTNLCENYDQIGYTSGGGYGELVVAPSHVVHRLPDHVSFETGVLIEPASCVLRGFERAEPAEGEAIGVVGIGTLGSIAIMLARSFSPRRVVALGVRPEELALAESLGADEVVDVSRPGAGLPTDLDLVIETAGATAAVDTAMHVARRGGRVVVMGLVGAGGRVELEVDRFVRQDLTLIASVSYTSGVWGRMMEIAARGSVELDRLVTHRFPLADFSTAFEALRNPTGHVVKILLEHGPVDQEA